MVNSTTRNRKFVDTSPLPISSWATAKRRDPFHRVFVAQVLLAKVWNFRLFGLTVRDVDCAYKLPKQVKESVKLKNRKRDNGLRIYYQTKAAGFRIKQLPVIHYPRLCEQTGGNWRTARR